MDTKEYRQSNDETRENAEKILEGDRDNYDGADGARIVVDLCNTISYLLTEIESLQTSPKAVNLAKLIRSKLNGIYVEVVGDNSAENRLLTDDTVDELTETLNESIVTMLNESVQTSPEPFDFFEWLKKYAPSSCCDTEERLTVGLTSDEDGILINDYDWTHTGEGKTLKEACASFLKDKHKHD